MQCCDVIDQLPDLLYDELDAPAHRAIEHHILGCPTCRLERESLQRTMQALDQWKSMESSGDPQTIARVAEVLARNRSNERMMRPALMGVAAAVLFFIGLSLLRAEIRYAEGGMSVSFGGSQVSAPSSKPTDSEFLLVLYEEPATAARITTEQGRQLAQEYAVWARHLIGAGHTISGQKLMDERGRILRKQAALVDVRSGDDELADEFITGYFRLRANSYDEAVELVKSCPHLRYGSRIELRQIDPLEG